MTKETKHEVKAGNLKSEAAGLTEMNMTQSVIEKRTRCSNTSLACTLHGAYRHLVVHHTSSATELPKRLYKSYDSIFSNFQLQKVKTRETNLSNCVKNKQTWRGT